MTDITAKLAEALRNLRNAYREFDDRPLPVVDAANEALRAYRQHTEAQAGGTGSERRDAERYRWLRKNREVTLVTAFFGNGCINKTIDMVDAEIDARAAMAAAPAAEQGEPKTDDARFKAAMKELDHRGFNLWRDTSVFEKSLMLKAWRAAKAEMAKAEQAVPVAWERIAWLLAEQNGDEPGTLIWEGNPPEPWGEVWCRYEKQARQIAELFPPATERRPLTDERIRGIWVEHGLDDCDCEGFARAIEAAHGITAGTTEQAKEQGNG